MSTLRDVARRSGVSPATVSNVLNNRATRVSDETRQRVLQAIRELDYYPGASPASRQVARTIGIFLWLGYSAPLTSNPYALAILDGILTVMLADHWNTTFISVQNWKDARAQVRLYADGRCDGFILLATPQTVNIPQALTERNYPFVVLGSGLQAPFVSGVAIDSVKAAYDLTNYLISQGHKRIAYLPGDEDQEDALERRQGYRQALLEAGLARNAFFIEPGTYDIPQSLILVNQFIDRFKQMPPEHRPTALMCGNDQVAYNAWKALRERGVQVPDNISLVGFDDTPFSLLTEPPLTTVRQPLFDLGFRGAQILQQQLYERVANQGAKPQPPRTPVKETLPHEIVIRHSVKRLDHD